VVDEPANAPGERAGTDPFEIIGGFIPVKPAAGGRQYGGGFAHASGQGGSIDAVDGGLFAVGDHDLVSEHIDGLKAEKLAVLQIDDPDSRLCDFAFPQAHRRHHEDDITVLCRQPVMSGGGAEADVIRIGDATGERQKVAVAQSIRHPAPAVSVDILPRLPVLASLYGAGIG